jgi:hypothetical protein
MTMGALASAFLSALSLRPAVEMGLGMTIAGLISMSLIGLGVLRGRQQDVRTL